MELTDAVGEGAGISMKLYNDKAAWEAEQMTDVDLGALAREALAVRRERDASRRMEREKFVDEVQRRVADAMGLADGDSRTLCLTDLGLVVRTVCEAGHRANAISVSLPERDFRSIMRGLGGRPDATKFRYNGAEFLRGGKEVIIWWAVKMVESDREALEAEILRCLGRGGVAKLPQSASGNGVSPRAKPVSEVGIAPSPASGNDRNPNGLAHLSNEAKIIAAKEAIAAYARNKQLPSAEHLALFGELDGKRAGNKGANPRIEELRASADWSDLDFAAHIKRNNNRLSAEPLSRAIDQLWVRENGGSYADLISSRSERLAEMVCRGDSAADGERG